MEAKFPTLILLTSRLGSEDFSDLAQQLQEVQEVLLNDLGLLTPLIRIEQNKGGDSSIPMELQLDGRTIGAFPNRHLVSRSIVESLRKHVGELLVEDLLRFYLNSLNLGFPTLVEAARKQVGIESLMVAIRKRVKNGSSIRDLRGVLEDLVLQTAS